MAGNVKELLRGLVGGIEGVVGATVVGMDGNTIEALKVNQNFPLVRDRPGRCFSQQDS